MATVWLTFISHTSTSLLPPHPCSFSPHAILWFFESQRCILSTISRDWIVTRNLHQRPGPWRGGEIGGKLPRAPRRLGPQPSLKNIQYTRMHHLKKLKFWPQRGPAKMFPWAPLWLSNSWACQKPAAGHYQATCIVHKTGIRLQTKTTVKTVCVEHRRPVLFWCTGI